MIKIYIRFPLTDITSKYEKKARPESKFIPFPFGLTLTSILFSYLLEQKKIYSRARCNPITGLQKKKKVIDT